MRRPSLRSKLRNRALLIVMLLYVAVLAGMFIRERLQSIGSKDFVSLEEVDPTIVVEARYAGSHNFVGRPVRGYKAAKCRLVRRAADGLKAAQAEARQFGLSLKVYDCYRPQRAVDDFVEWAGDLRDEKMKAEFYPSVAKAKLFEEGYIFGKSGHSRGSTVDVTLVPHPTPAPEVFNPAKPLRDCRAPAVRRFGDNSIDMGTGYDCFDELAHTASPAISESARRNRLLLKWLMEKNGFKNYEKEWWHFTLVNEPFPETYFDDEVE